MVASFGLQQALAQAVGQQDAVRQVGQGIEVRNVLELHALLLELFFHLNALADVARNHGGSSNTAKAVQNRRDGNRDMQHPAVFAAAHGFIVRHMLACAHA